MAHKVFTVEHYRVSLNHELTASWSGTIIKARGKIVCQGDDHLLFAYFLKDDNQIPEPVYMENDNAGAIFLPFIDMGTFIDILRNEKPVYAYLDSDKPEWIGIGTFREPVTERES